MFNRVRSRFFRSIVGSSTDCVVEVDLERNLSSVPTPTDRETSDAEDEFTEEPIAENNTTSVVQVQNAAQESNIAAILKTCLRLDYFSGFCPFYASDDQSCKSNWIATIVFIIFNICAAVYTTTQIRICIWFLDQSENNTMIEWYMEIGYELSVLLLQTQYSYLLLRKRQKIEELFACLHSFSVSQECGMKEWKSLFYAMLIRAGSILFCIMSLVGGFHALKSDENWSFSKIIKFHTTDMKIAMQDFRSDGNPNMTSYFLFKDLNVGNVTLGIIGIILELLHQVLQSCPLDLLLLSALTLWLSVRNMKKQLLRVGSLESEENPTSHSHQILQGHKELQLLSRKINEVLAVFLPYGTMMSILMTSYLIQVCLSRSWLISLTLLFKLGKLACTFWFALEISQYMNSYQDWFALDETQQNLDLDLKTLQIKILQNSQFRVGIGTTPYFMDSTFIANFLGAAFTYFIVLASAREGGSKDCS